MIITWRFDNHNFLPKVMAFSQKSFVLIQSLPLPCFLGGKDSSFKLSSWNVFFLFRYQYIYLSVKTRPCQTKSHIENFLKCFQNQLNQHFLNEEMNCLPIHLKEFLSSRIKKDGSYPICDGKNDSKPMQEFGNYFKVGSKWAFVV